MALRNKALTCAALVVLFTALAPAAHAQPAPCCTITAINARAATVSAKINSSGQTFEFRVANPLLLRAGGPGPAAAVDYPLALHTRWTYHLRHEVGPGVHFDGEYAALAKGNVLEDTVVSEVAGKDRIGNLTFMRVENRRSRGLWLIEWYRAAAEGLFLGKTIEAEAGTETLMSPPQKVLTRTLRVGGAWTWQASDAPVKIHVNVKGTSALTVPAGTYAATEIAYVLTMPTPGGMVRAEQTRWFVPGIGWVKQETRTRIGTRLLTHITVTLEKFEPVAARETIR
jgi:hypothetical protein